MLTVQNVALQYGKRILFQDVNLQFTKGNCYGVIGANGAGKSTFLKILSGEIEPNRGEVIIEPGNRMAVLTQNHFKFDEFEVLNTVIMGYKELYDIMVEKDAIYAKAAPTDADNMRAGDLEGQFAEMNGWMAETEAAEMLSALGIKEADHYKKLKELSSADKVKVLLAQALFGNPDILLLDEPTNDLDAETNTWLCEFLAEYQNIVIVVSHDRHFLDMVCTHVVDVDFQKIRIFTGNYTFWYESSQLMMRQIADKNKKVETKRQEMMEFIARFSANASKSRQATSRKKALEKLNLEEMRPSSRKYPFIHFKPEREPGNEIFRCDKLSKRGIDGQILFQNISFAFNKGDKVALISRNSTALTAFFNVIGGVEQADGGKFEFGQTITPEYIPNDNSKFFTGVNDDNLIDWLRPFSKEKDEAFLRGFLGRMLFSGEEVFKQASVLSGGEKVRSMFSRAMLHFPNFLILDEPTNHLDLESITSLNNALVDFKGSLIFTSHDLQIMDTVPNRIIEISPNGMIDKMMNFTEYIQDEKVKAQRGIIYRDLAPA